MYDLYFWLIFHINSACGVRVCSNLEPGFQSNVKVKAVFFKFHCWIIILSLLPNLADILPKDCFRLFKGV